MSHVNSIDWDSLQPVFVQGTGQFDDKQYIYNYGSKIQASYGNNGASMNAYVKGVARQGFKIQFKLGYTWGYSTFYMANQTVVNQQGASSGQYQNSGVNGIRFMNNSSNNVLHVDKNVNGTITRIRDTTGVNDTLITLWRDASNVVKFKVGSDSEVTVGTFTDTFVFGITLQSPSSVELIMAMNLQTSAS